MNPLSMRIRSYMLGLGIGVLSSTATRPVTAPAWRDELVSIDECTQIAADDLRDAYGIQFHELPGARFDHIPSAGRYKPGVDSVVLDATYRAANDSTGRQTTCDPASAPRTILRHEYAHFLADKYMEELFGRDFPRQDSITYFDVYEQTAPMPTAPVDEHLLFTRRVALSVLVEGIAEYMEHGFPRENMRFSQNEWPDKLTSPSQGYLQHLYYNGGYYVVTPVFESCGVDRALRYFLANQPDSVHSLRDLIRYRRQSIRNACSESRHWEEPNEFLPPPLDTTIARFPLPNCVHRVDTLCTDRN
jgi:hypothetical protein